jgi:hypothetical protein
MALTITDPGPLQLMGDALIARLKLVFPETKFQHETVPAKVDANQWRKLTQRTPFIGLGWNDAEAGHNGGRPFDGQARWTVFLVTKNIRGTRERYWGDALAPGLFRMVHGAIAMLNGFTIPGVGTAEVTRAANMYAEGWDDNDMAMAAVDLTVGLTIDLANSVSPPDGLDPFHNLGISWDFDPSAATGLGPGNAGQEDIDTVGTAP